MKKIAAPPKRGRPPLPEAERYSEKVTVRLTPPQRAKYDRLEARSRGWFRNQVAIAKEPPMK